MAQDRRGDDIDSILQELREKTEEAAPVSDAKLNEIMSELGYGEPPGNSSSATPKTSPAAQAKPQQRPPVQQKAKEKPAEPPPAPKREMPAQEKPRPKNQATDIWDIEVESGPAEYRTGKAAALDFVQPDKFANDEELARWFEGGGNIAMDKKEQRRLDKERKRQEAEERKREKQRGKNSAPDDEYYADDTEDGYSDDIYDDVEPPANYEDNYSPSAYEEAPYEEARPARPKNADDPRRFFTLEDIDEYGRPRGADELADGAFFVTEDGPVKLQWDPNPPAPEAPPPPQEYFERGYEPDAEGYYTRKEIDEPLAPPPDWDAPPEEDVLTGSAFETPWEASWPEQDSLMGKNDQAAPYDTMVFERQQAEEPQKVPTSAFTQEFTIAEGWEPTHPDGIPRSLYVDEMVDDRFREFFSETVSVQEDEIEHGVKKTERRARRKRRRQFTTGEFAKLGEEAEERVAFPVDDDDDEYEEYNRPQDAPAIEGSIFALLRSLRIRFFATLGLAVLLLWLGLGAANVLPLPGFANPTQSPMGFALLYLVLVLGAVGLNFATVAPGLVGLAAEPTVDSAPALAGLGALLQAVVVLVQMLTKTPLDATLFGGVAALLLAVNALGKQIRAGSILDNFQLASAGAVHSAAYVLDTRYDEAYDLTRGLEEDHPALLISRPTSLMKGFMRQSFSPRRSDAIGRILAWVLLGVGLLVSIITYVKTQQLFAAVSAFAAALCLGAPLTSSLVSGLPSMLMQRGASHVGAVVPGWSAIEELGGVNVVIAGDRDLFPPSSIRLHGLRAFEMQNINSAILYAASVLVQGCDTLREIFLALVNSRADTLYKAESLIYEPGRGYTAWVDEKRIVLGNREMMQKHDIALPSIEQEMKYVQDRDRRPLYLAVSGKLYAMFVVGYSPNEDVQLTLDSLVSSGVSLLVDSTDMNIGDELIEDVYDLPRGFVKVLGVRELEKLEPLTSYLDESEGVMSHAGTFSSFIGGMRAAASCASAEHMGSILQMISVGFCCLLSLVLAFAGGLSGLSVFPLLLCHLAWSLVALAIPFGRKY